MRVQIQAGLRCLPTSPEDEERFQADIQKRLNEWLEHLPWNVQWVWSAVQAELEDGDPVKNVGEQ